MAFLERLEQARNELAKHSENPLRKRVENAVRGIEAISTAALLDRLRLPATTGTARDVAPILRALGFIPIKSRRLMPGGFRDTVTRGWARPVRTMKSSPTIYHAGGAGFNQQGMIP
jgi:hypothetical protein